MNTVQTIIGAAIVGTAVGAGSYAGTATAIPDSGPNQTAQVSDTNCSALADSYAQAVNELFALDEDAQRRMMNDYVPYRAGALAFQAAELRALADQAGCDPAPLLAAISSQ